MTVAHYKRSAIAVANNGDLEAIRAEIHASTTEDLMTKYGKDESGVRRWEQRYNAHTKRVCRGCKETKSAHEMGRTHDDRISWRCLECKDEKVDAMSAYHRARGAKRRAETGGYVDGEMPSLTPTLLMSPRLKLSDQQGHWMRWGQPQ